MDPGTALGVASLMLAVAHDLYDYCKAVRGYETDIKNLRRDLLQLQSVAGQTVTALRRPGLAAEDHSGVQKALANCTDARKNLQVAVDRIQTVNSQSGGFRRTVKRWTTKAAYPHTKSTLDGLSKDVATCQSACGQAIELLGLNVGATAVESVQRVDDRLGQGVQEIRKDLADTQTTNQASKLGIDKILVNQVLQVAQQTDEHDKECTRKIIAQLRCSDHFSRKESVNQARSSTLEWMLSADPQYSARNGKLLDFLRSGSGIFWIRGKPGSGKSTFMKYLLQHSSTISLLRQWAGSEAVVTPNHFFWVPGSQMQKSYRGMLQSLLYQVFNADPATASRILRQQEKDKRLRAADDDDFWTDEAMEECLRDALSSGNRHHCFFVDGLDECHPESEHTRVIDTLGTLSSFGGVKIIASSRPWPVFEQNLKESGRNLTMEEVNRDSIVNYIRDRVQAIKGAHVFSDVDWQVVTRLQACPCSECPKSCKRTHQQSQVLTENIVRRAEGVFLWTSLIMDRICPRISAGNSLEDLRKYVKEFPDNLEAFFQDQVDRIDKCWRPETLMALKLASLPDMQDSWFVMLANKMGSKESPLWSPCFPYDMNFYELDSPTCQDMWQKTCTLVEYCGRDLLTLCQSSKKNWDHWTLTYSSNIQFTHRAAFDFLQTSAMAEFLNQGTPLHSESAEFRLKLEIGRFKLVDSRAEPTLSLCINFSSIISRISRSQLPDALMAEAERVLIHRLGNSYLPLEDVIRLLKSDANLTLLATSILDICKALALRGLYELTSLVLIQRWRVLLMKISDSLAGPIWFAVGFHTRRMISHTDCRLLDLLLSHGVDPNLDITVVHRDHSWISLEMLPQDPRHLGRLRMSPWTAFLGRLQFNGQPSSINAKILDYEDTVLGPFATESGDPSSTVRESFSDPHVQAAIKTFLASGANLYVEVEVLLDDLDGSRGYACEPSPAIEILRANLSDNGDGTDWSSLLDMYCQPEKQEEIRISRQKLDEEWTD